MRWSLLMRSTQGPTRHSSADQMSGLSSQGVRLKVVVSDSYEGYRINKFVLLEEFRRVLGSRSSSLDAVKRGFLLLNGEKNVEPTRLLKAGDRVELLEGYQACLGAMLKLERRMSTENIKIFWKPPGFPLAPDATVTENDEIRPAAEGAFTSLYRVNRGVGAFLVMLRDGCSEREYVQQSLSAVMRALVDSKITSSVSIPANDGRMYEVSPLTSTKTGTGYVTTVDVVCNPLDISCLKDSLGKAGINVLTKSGGRARSALKGTYVSMVSLRFSTGKPDRTREHTFHNEEPEKFKALRKREEKFQAKKCTSVRHEDDMPVAYLRGTQEFDGLSLFVEKQSVIVPRKATETLVHACMNALRGNSVAHSTMSRRGIYSLLMSIALRSLAATCTRRCCGRPPTNT
uniref:RNA-binding S4 domain-containing protein n=1 Tax=Rhodosorus marinus TaxID=101924 RepID=A0A7S2ZG48_9RHOD|mmetsp:Transcript_18540/g.74513  ORF Transcript_18540/g.74513 Transcript_18540/m.74513 type:complete len:401 (+) Transcript_18540:234-1436(+)